MNFLSSYKKVFSKKSYLLLAIIISLSFYSLNALISGFSEIKSFYSYYSLSNAIKLTFLNISGFHYRILTHSLISLIIISVLFGLLFSLITFKTKTLSSKLLGKEKKFRAFTTTGIFLGVLAPGCAACGVGIVSFLGLGAFLSFLPYEGLELSILSIILLLFANYKISKNIVQHNVCKVFDDHQEPRSKK